jgi:hypothetical protein
MALKSIKDMARPGIVTRSASMAERSITAAPSRRSKTAQPDIRALNLTFTLTKA